jgi:hypothetical protein
MKKIAVTALLALAGSVTVGRSLAQTTHEVRANIPFDFAVGKQVLPAGHYHIDSESTRASTDEVLIQNSDHPRIAVLIRTSGNPKGWTATEWATRGELVFDQYGDQHVLCQIRGPVAAVNAELPMSKSEKSTHLHKVADVPDTTQTYVAVR